MLVDMHLHEKTYSLDSMQELKEMVKVAKTRGLDAICITDHDSMGLKDFAEQYSKEIGFPIFVGVEFFSLQGDITAFGIDAIPSDRINAQAFIDYVLKRGGVCFACHPFRNNNRGLREKLKLVKGLTGIEVLNGSTPYHDNNLAFEYCKELQLMPIGASDAHDLNQLGKYATWLPNDVYTLKDFVKEIKKGISKPAILGDNGYMIVDSI
ncbi:MAG: PHP domain-containing protein [Tissierellia bacterium]|nr:PHP domain-containing protein [Tissierellia bacterium]